MASPFLKTLLIGTLQILSCVILVQGALSTQDEIHSQQSWRGVDRQRTLEGRVATGYLFAHDTDRLLNSSDPTDAELFRVLDYVSPNMKPTRDFIDLDNITIPIAKRAWQLLYQHAKVAMEERIKLSEFYVEDILRQAGVSKACQDAAHLTLEAAKRMDAWAVKLVTSWGAFPTTGIYVGTNTDLGSYDACVNIPVNQHIDHAHYCTLSFRPVLASPKKFRRFNLKESDEMLRLFENSSDKQTGEQNAFQEIMQHAHYYHYVHFMIGSCWPIGCNVLDIRRVAKLIGRKNILRHGPVKCHSRHSRDYEEIYDFVEQRIVPSENVSIVIDGQKYRRLEMTTSNKFDEIYVMKPVFNDAQKVALAIVLGLLAIVASATLIDLAFNYAPEALRFLKSALTGQTPKSNQVARTDCATRPNQEAELLSFENVKVNKGQYISNNGSKEAVALTIQTQGATRSPSNGYQVRIVKDKSSLMQTIEGFSIIRGSKDFYTISQARRKNDITCLDGIRVITMNWSILTHTLLYNDWQAFARGWDVEKMVVESFVTQPIFNASYLVDTFFLMSGLVSSYALFKRCRGDASKFKSINHIVNRWLRLTPQVWIVSLLIILLPLLAHGPFWYALTGEHSENCATYWWVNVIHMQAFYKPDSICNFATWWLSIDFFYDCASVVFIWILLLLGHKHGFFSLIGMLVCAVSWQAFRHYQQSLPPNVMSTIPQLRHMWAQFTILFFWTPYSHAVPYFFGFYSGYLYALKAKLVRKWITPRRALIGWTLSTSFLIGQSYAIYPWVIGTVEYTRISSTLFHITAPILWAASLCWVITACHFGFGGMLNRFLSCEMFTRLARLTYMIYLSHFLCLMAFIGSPNVLLEPSGFALSYMVMGNIIVSTLLGLILNIFFEQAWLKIARKIMICIQ